MKKILLLACLFVFAASSALAADISLPAPKTQGGPDVLTAVKKRSSAPGNGFPTKAVSKEELSTILWAASGLNRDNKWTVPMAQGREPYCDVYVVGDEGVFLYDWKANKLKEISNAKVKADLGGQGWAGTAPYVLVFVENGAKLSAFSDPARRASFGYILVGAMTQNVYLAAQAMNIGARYAATLSVDKVRMHLKLKADDKPVCIMPIGHY